MPGFTINSVAISGNQTRDPELRQVGETSICKVRLAVSERFKDRNTGEWSDRPNYFDVTIFGGLGTWLAGNSKKGDTLAVTGRLSWREWETDGQKRSAVEIIADTIVPVTRNGSGSGRSTSSDVPIDTEGLPPVSNLPDVDEIPFLWHPVEWDDRYHANR